MSEVQKIWALILDVDGTLTDGSIHISESGELFKSFYCRDGIGIQVAIKQGIRVILLTSRESEIVTRRAQELGICNVYQNCTSHKKETVISISEELEISLEHIAYMGDDINDYEAMQLCGLSGCPADAVELIKTQADYICKLNGGKGAVREFIEIILGDNFVYC